MPSRDLVHALDDSRLHSFATGDRALEHTEDTFIEKVFLPAIMNMKCQLTLSQWLLLQISVFQDF